MDGLREMPIKELGSQLPPQRGILGQQVERSRGKASDIPTVPEYSATWESARLRYNQFTRAM
jgi:hypothetical protein